MTYLICAQINSNLKQGSMIIIQQKDNSRFNNLYLLAEDFFCHFLCQTLLPLEVLALPEVL